MQTRILHCIVFFGKCTIFTKHISHNSNTNIFHFFFLDVLYSKSMRYKFEVYLFLWSTSLLELWKYLFLFFLRLNFILSRLTQLPCSLNKFNWLRGFECENSWNEIFHINRFWIEWFFKNLIFLIYCPHKLNFTHIQT